MLWGRYEAYCNILLEGFPYIANDPLIIIQLLNCNAINGIFNVYFRGLTNLIKKRLRLCLSSFVYPFHCSKSLNENDIKYRNERIKPFKLN